MKREFQRAQSPPRQPGIAPSPAPPPGDPDQLPRNDRRPSPFLHPVRASEYRRARAQRRSFVSDIDDLERANQVFDLRLKQRVSVLARVAVFLQLFIADCAFGVYLGYNISTNRPIATAAINAWLGAVVIQVIGILYIITRYLFPSQGTKINRRHRDAKQEADRSNN